MARDPAPILSTVAPGKALLKADNASRALRFACWVVMLASAMAPKSMIVDSRLRDGVIEASIISTADHILVQTFCTDAWKTVALQAHAGGEMTCEWYTTWCFSGGCTPCVCRVPEITWASTMFVTK